jgi:hypothetical protein
MLLTITGLRPLIDPDHFHALFGRYVYGYKTWTHCDKCFKARHEPLINPEIASGPVEPIRLKDDLFYLCGVGRDLSPRVHPTGARNSTNVHLAVCPRKGSVAAIGSVYGTTFVIEDAQAIPIQVPTKEFSALDDLSEPERTTHLRCKMFQFAYQMFDVDQISLTKGDAVHKLRDQWLAYPGIRRDSLGCMIDPKPYW